MVKKLILFLVFASSVLSVMARGLPNERAELDDTLYDDTMPPPLYDDTMPPPLYDDTMPPPLYDDTMPPLLYDDTMPPPLYDDTMPPPLYDDTMPPPLYDQGDQSYDEPAEEEMLAARGILDKAKNVLDKARKKAEEYTDKAKDKVNEAKKKAGGVLGKLPGKRKLNMKKNNIVPSVQDSWIHGALEDQASKEEMLAARGILDKAKNALDKAGKKAEEYKNKAKDKVNEAKNKAGGLLDKVPGKRTVDGEDPASLESEANVADFNRFYFE